MGASIIPSLVAASAAAARDRAVLDAFDAAGAVGPAHAVPLAALPPLDPDVLAALIERGTVREGAPGTFYRFASARSGEASPAARWLPLIIVGLILLGVGALAVLLRAYDAR
jgi:hypothetical protein